MGARQAVSMGLLDAAFGAGLGSFDPEVRRVAERLARDADRGLAAKRRRRTRDQHVKPLHAYRAEEMARTHRCFFGPGRSYHEARRRFVYKLRVPSALPAGEPSTGTASSRPPEGLAA